MKSAFDFGVWRALDRCLFFSRRESRDPLPHERPLSSHASLWIKACMMNGRTSPAGLGPFVCVGRCSQLRIWHNFGNRSYLSGVLIGSRVVALMGLRMRLGLISGKVLADHKGRQTLGAYFLRSMLSSLSRTPFDRGKRQMVSKAISLGASNRVPCRRTLHAVRASLLASAMAALLRGMRFTASVSHGPKLKADHLF